MLDALKDALTAKPLQALSVSIGFWILAAAMTYLPSKLEAMITVGMPILVVGAIGYLIPAFKGIADLAKDFGVNKSRRLVVENLNVAAKDMLWGLLITNRRSITLQQIDTMNRELSDHCIMDWKGGSKYQISDEYWPLLYKEGKLLLYKGKFNPSNEWPKD